LRQDGFAFDMEYWNVEDPVFSHAFGGIDLKGGDMILK
jgi:hypothetical protein